MSCYNNSMLAKFFAIGIIYTMSFLGYNQSDYSFLLPSSIKSIIEQGTTTDNENVLPVSKQTIQTENISTNKNKQIETKKETKKIVATTSVVNTKIILPNKISSTTQIINTNELEVMATTTLPKVLIYKNNTSPIFGKLLSSTSSVDEKISSSVVNVYCQAIRGSNIETITGSAVQVDPSGVYITNAHVAIYVMLSDTEPVGTVSCYIRENSPAKKIYEAKSVYIPSSWISSHANAYKIGIELVGTGEKDYALIKRGNSNPTLNQNDFPSEWSSPLATILPIKGQNIILSGYPVFDKSVISSALYLMTNNSSILNVFNLNGESNSLFDSESTKLAQIGSSGGGAFDQQGNLFGIMGAAINNTPGELPSERIIGINYIKSDILKDTGKTFESLLQNNKTESLNFIKNIAPSLSKVLISNQ